ncbi:unnamed protein product, partial [Polarella glacialis]
AIDAEILKSFEYWLGVKNLPQDSFLRRQIRLSEDRFVPIRVFTTFNRLKVWCHDVCRIAGVLRRSAVLEVRGEGVDAEVRALEDFSVRPHEDEQM